jgi:hypothetical protein
VLVLEELLNLSILPLGLIYHDFPREHTLGADSSIQLVDFLEPGTKDTGITEDV